MIQFEVGRPLHGPSLAPFREIAYQRLWCTMFHHLTPITLVAKKVVFPLHCLHKCLVACIFHLSFLPHFALVPSSSFSCGTIPYLTKETEQSSIVRFVAPSLARACFTFRRMLLYSLIEVTHGILVCRVDTACYSFRSHDGEDLLMIHMTYPLWKSS